MCLSFGDMMKEVNVFHLGKQPRDLDDQSFKVNLIEGLTSEHDKEIEYESDGEFELESDDFNLDHISNPQWSGKQTQLLSFPYKKNNH